MLLYCPQFCKTFAAPSRSARLASDVAWGRRRSHPLVRTIVRRILRLTGMARIQPSLAPLCCTRPPLHTPASPSPSILSITVCCCTHMVDATTWQLICSAHQPRCAASPLAPDAGQSCCVRGREVGSETVRGLGREAVRGLGREAVRGLGRGRAWFGEKSCVVWGETVRGLRRANRP